MILKGTCVVGQSGGPTAAINASALGCIETMLDHTGGRVLGASHGIKGVLGDRLYDLGLEDRQELALMRTTPASVLGTCRYKLQETDLDRIFQVFRKYDVRYFFYIGGNDSMDTCARVDAYLRDHDYDCRVLGIPKTIDNDLALTDHCPGYGCAAKYVATTCLEIYRDAKAYDQGSITVVEIMGRNAGWLTAAASLGGRAGLGPDLVYLPELPFSVDDFTADVARIYDREGDVLVAVSEGVRDESGTLLSEKFCGQSKEFDAFGHAQMGGLAAGLAAAAERLVPDAKVRGIEFSLIQRCASHIASATDLEESYNIGRFAAESALAGESGKMAVFRRTSQSPYRCETMLVPLDEVANLEKKFPRQWISEAGNQILPSFHEYALPLIQGEVDLPLVDGLPRFATLQRIMTRDL